MTVCLLSAQASNAAVESGVRGSDMAVVWSRQSAPRTGEGQHTEFSSEGDTHYHIIVCRLISAVNGQEGPQQGGKREPRHMIWPDSLLGSFGHRRDRLIKAPREHS